MYVILSIENFVTSRYRKGDFDMTANEQLASVGKNIQEKATLIWNVANTLFGAFKPHEYGLVILPMVVIKPRLPAAHSPGGAGYIQEGGASGGQGGVPADCLRIPVL